jgi:hypothetical protein
MFFKGTAHNPAVQNPKGSNSDPADLSSAEIAATRMKCPLLMDHDRGNVLGNVFASWQGTGGELRVSGIVRDKKAARLIQNGEMRGLSLGTGVATDPESGKPVHKHQEELSVCKMPRRPGCWIDSINGNRVLTQSCASRKGAHCKGPPSAPHNPWPCLAICS